LNNPIVPRARPIKDNSDVRFDATEYKEMVGCLMYI